MAVAGSLVVLLVLAGGVLLYDSSRKDTVAKGVTVGGVDVGGLERAAAEEKLQAELDGRLRQPIVAEYHRRRFTLTPERARVQVDVRGSVDAAVQRSRASNLVTRTFRGLTGGTIDEDVDVAVTYDRSAVRALVRRVRSRLDRPARDADVDISTAGVSTVRARRGRQIDAHALRRGVRRKLVSLTSDRTYRITADPIKPKVTNREVAKKYPKVIVVSRSTFKLQLYERLKPTKSYTVAIGAAGYDTPTGLYNIQNKAVDPVWSVPDSDWAGSLAGTTVPPGPSNPLKSRWMGIYNGAGIHGTDAVSSLGSAASHGCVRMAVPDVEDLYDRVDVGTPVFIG